MRISDWSSDVCSSDLAAIGGKKGGNQTAGKGDARRGGGDGGKAGLCDQAGTRHIPGIGQDETAVLVQGGTAGGLLGLRRMLCGHVALVMIVQGKDGWRRWSVTETNVPSATYQCRLRPSCGRGRSTTTS